MRAALMLDPTRREEQLAMVRDRVERVQEFGTQLWVSITDEQADRFAQQGIGVQKFPDADLVRLPAIAFRPPDETPQPPPDLTAHEPAGEERAYYIVLFAGPLDPQWLNTITALDGKFVEDLPGNAEAFCLTANQAAQVAELLFIDWIGLYHPAYALHYTLAGRAQPFSAVDLRDMRVDPARVPSSPQGNIQVAFFDDIQTADMHDAVTAAGAAIHNDNGRRLVVEIAVDRIPDLLRVRGVQAVERFVASGFDNQRQGIITGVDQIRNRGITSLPVDLDGTGEIVGIMDSGLHSGNFGAVHGDVNARVILLVNSNDPAPPPPPGPAPAPATTCQDFETHGTHVTGTVAGDGSGAIGFVPPAFPSPLDGSNVTPPASIPRGAAPGAQIVFHSVNSAPPPDVAPRQATQAPLNFNNYIQVFQTAHAWGARVHTNSWGNEGTNTYSVSDSEVIDRFAYLNPEDLIVFSAGNNEADLDGNGVLDSSTMGDYAVTKNALIVGASENVTRFEGLFMEYRQAWATRYSSSGLSDTAGPAPNAGDYPISDRADDIAMFSKRGLVVGSNRVRPDIVAPGTNILSTAPAPMPAHDTGRPTKQAHSAPPALYYVLSGTSMAAPHVAGCALLVRQFYRSAYGQVRRPVLLSREPAEFVERPTIVPHRDGLLAVWVRREGSRRDIRGARFTRALQPFGEGRPMQLDAGDHPAVSIARHGDATLVLFRGGDNSVRLQRYNPDLTTDGTFGTSGTLTLTPQSHPEDDHAPSFCVNGDEAAVVWVQQGADTLLFQRFSAITGAAIDANALTLGTATSTSSAPYVLHNGTRYVAVWKHFDGTNNRVLMRFVSNAGAVEGADPFVVFSDPAEATEPHFAWNSRTSQFLVCWISDRDIRCRLVDANGAAVGGAPFSALSVAAGKAVRAPRLVTHPTAGFVLGWEDNTRGTQAVYAMFLGENGQPDGRIRNNRLLLSDTPGDTQGFTLYADATGIVPLWQSNDEVRALFAMLLTPAGGFQAEADPRVPIIDSGRYVPYSLNEHGTPDLFAVDMTWAGGNLYMIRGEPGGFLPNIRLVRVNPDGLPDDRYGTNGVRTVDSTLGIESLTLQWAGTRLMAASVQSLWFRVFLFDAAGAPEPGFGVGGKKIMVDLADSALPPQLASDGAGNTFRMLIAYGRWAPAGSHLRYTVLDRQANTVIAALDLDTAAGAARHGWFHWVPSDTPARSIAVWHVNVAGGHTALRLNRFQIDGTKHHPAALGLGIPAGDASNGVLAPRPVDFNGSMAVPPPPAPHPMAQREYGLVYQHRAAAANPWKIRFSRLNRDGTPQGVAQNVVVMPGPGRQTDPQLVWHTDGYGLAWREQAAAAGPHRLMFTVLDQNGVALITPAYAVSSAAANVRDFRLVWNGRSFRVTWTEDQGGRLRHMETAIGVPRGTGAVALDHPYEHPTSALLRATMINGATNLRNRALPSVGDHPNDGYGWGRVNLRQSLAPAPPVTYHARDDSSVASGSTVRYEFTLPRGTRLLRVTLVWTDPPGNQIVNDLHLQMTTPPFCDAPSRVYVGNRWRNNGQYSNPVTQPAPADVYEKVHTVEQIVIPGAPIVPPGVYVVEVIGGPFSGSNFRQFPGQPFSLVFVGSGDEWRLTPAASGQAAGVY